MRWNRTEFYELINIDSSRLQNFKVDLTVQDQDDPESMAIIEKFVSPSEFKFYMQRHFASWWFLYPDDTDPLEYLRACWSQYLNDSNVVNWGKLWEAFNFKYNPIENYDKNSRIETENTGSEKNTLSYSGESTNTFETPDGGYTDTTSSYRSPEDSGDYVPTDKVESTIAKRNETNTTSYNDRKDENEKTFEDRKDIVTEKTHGNIGVSTAMDMALKEVEARKYNLQEEIFKGFANRYLLLF